jgi:hypothetical protein
MMTDEERADFHLYMRIMDAWGDFVVRLRPPGFSPRIDFEDALAVVERRACCIWRHSPHCPKPACDEVALGVRLAVFEHKLEYLGPDIDWLEIENEAVFHGLACWRWDRPTSDSRKGVPS